MTFSTPIMPLGNNLNLYPARGYERTTCGQEEDNKEESDKKSIKKGDEEKDC